MHEDYVTEDNKDFFKEVVKDRYIDGRTGDCKELLTNSVEWHPNLKRTGVIAKKIGIYPLWLKNGKKISTTLLQVRIFQLIFNKTIVDNYVCTFELKLCSDMN